MNRGPGALLIVPVGTNANKICFIDIKLNEVSARVKCVYKTVNQVEKLYRKPSYMGVLLNLIYTRDSHR